MMQERIANYFKTQPVVKAWVFGSYSRGEQKPWSDVDILVEFDKEKPIGLLKFAGIICDLEDLTGHKIDLVEEVSVWESGELGACGYGCLTKRLTDTVLEIFASGVLHDALIDDGKGQLVAVGRGAIACQTGDACQRTRLGADITFSGCLLHTVLEGAVDTGNRE